jgi:hypothetical protein
MDFLDSLFGDSLDEESEVSEKLKMNKKVVPQP